MPNFFIPFIVEIDASRMGLGAVLSQNQRRIAYFSPTLSARAQPKSTYERELTAIIMAINDGGLIF